MIMDIFYLVCDLITHMYYIVIDIFYYGSYEIFNGSGKTINSYFYTKRYAFYGTLKICNDVEKIIANYYKKEDSLITQHCSCGYKSIIDYIKSIDPTVIFTEHMDEHNLNNVHNVCFDASLYLAKKYLGLNIEYNEIIKNKYIIIDIYKTSKYIN
jgi:hypothetical protein